MIKQGFSFGKVTMVLLGTMELWEVQTRPAGDGSLRTADRSRWVRDQQVGHRRVSSAVHIFIALEDQLLGTAQVGIGQGAPGEEKEALVLCLGGRGKPWPCSVLWGGLASCSVMAPGTAAPPGSRAAPWVSHQQLRSKVDPRGRAGPATIKSQQIYGVSLDDFLPTRGSWSQRWSSGYDSELPMQGTQIQSLVRELESTCHN